MKIDNQVEIQLGLLTLGKNEYNWLYISGVMIEVNRWKD